MRYTSYKIWVIEWRVGIIFWLYDRCRYPTLFDSQFQGVGHAYELRWINILFAPSLSALVYGIHVDVQY